MKTTLLRATVAVFLAVTTASRGSAYELYPNNGPLGSATIKSLWNPSSGSVVNARVIGYSEYTTGTSVTLQDFALRQTTIYFPRNGHFVTHPDLAPGAHDAMRKLLKLAYQNQNTFKVTVSGFYIWHYYWLESNFADVDTSVTLNRNVLPTSQEGELTSATIEGSPSQFYGTVTLFRSRNSMGQYIYNTFQLLNGPTSTTPIQICEGENYSSSTMTYQSKSMVSVTRIEWSDVNAILALVVMPTWGVAFDDTLRPVDCNAANPPRNNNRLVHGGSSWTNL